jgi:hypothetical protein
MDKWVSQVESQNISVCSATIILDRPLLVAKAVLLTVRLVFFLALDDQVRSADLDAEVV